MGRFESPLQVVALFLTASVLSVGVIFFINAEARNRQTHNHSHPLQPLEPSPLRADELPKNEVGDAFTAGEKEQISSDVSLSSASLSSSSSTELTSSNYTSGSESVGGLGSEASRSPANNVTLLNFLEDGLEKLLVLIKQAKHTYKSYYLSEEKLSQQAGVEATSTSKTDCHPIKDNDTPPPGAEGEDGEATARLGKGSRNRPRRRKKRDVHEGAQVVAIVKRWKRAAAIPPGGSSKRGRIGENEPYYWQMLEDNNRESSHHHHHHHQKKENKNEAALQQRSGGSSNTEKELYYSHHQNQKNHQPHYHHPQPQQQDFGGGGVPENNHYIYPVGVPGAVASAFTSGSGGDNLQLPHGVGGAPGNHHHSSTSDFHKIRHAWGMHKLGGGGLDISVVERMILDTKSSGRGHPSQGGGGGQPNHNQNQQNQFGHAHFSPSGRSAKDPLSQSGHQHHNQPYAKSNAASNEASLLTTATTKTTHSGRQDQGLYVNHHQQQQMAQSLLPPTVTWLSGEGAGGSVNSTVRFLPLPSSSLATSSKQRQGRRKSDMESDEEENDPNDNMNKVNNNAGNDDDDDESKENWEASSSKTTRRKNRKQQRRKMKKGKKKNMDMNGELSYSLSSRDEQEVEETRTRSQEEEDYPLPFTPEEEESDSGDDDHDKQTNNNHNDNGYEDGNGDLGDPLIEEEDEEIDEDKEREDLLYNSNIDSDDNEVDEEDANNKNLEKERRTDGDLRFSHPASSHEGNKCFNSGDVLIVVALTCSLNAAFVLVIWALVRWFSISTNPKDKDFQNLGDCDDTLDPTVVFHGVTEDPCWALASKEVSGASASGGAGGMIGGGGGNTGMTLRSTASAAGMGTIGSRGRGYERGEVGGYMGTMGSVHSGNKVDLFPIMGKHGGGSALTNTIGAAVMTMTMERSRGGDNRGGGTGMYGHVGGGGSSSLMINGSGAGLYSFRPEHVPVHHGSSGQMHRSYSQSMEDLRYLQ